MSRTRKPVPHPLTVLGALREQAEYLLRRSGPDDPEIRSVKRIVELCQLLERAMIEQTTNHGGKPNE